MGRVANANDLPEGYKMTELGPLPEEWEVAFLGELFEIQQGKSLSPKHRTGKSPRPFLRTANVLWGRLDLSTLDEMDFTDEEMQRLCLKSGDLLVCEGGEIGRTAIWRGEIPACFYQNHLHRLRPVNDNVLPEFYMYWMQASLLLLGLYIGAANKTTIPNLSKSRLSKFKVPVPPLPEQKKIGTVLRTVQEAKEATERVIAATRELKKSLMRHLFTYGAVPLDQADQVPLQETELGRLPKHWKVVRLGDIFEIQQGKALSPRHRKGESPCPFLRTANVLWGRIDVSVLDEMDFTDKEIQRLRLLPGDLLVCEGGETGRTAMWRGELQVCCYQNHLHRLRARDKGIEPEFYMYWMHAAILLLGLYTGEANKTTIPNLSRARLASFSVPFPPFSEQREIARILQTVDRKIETEEGRKAALEALFKTLLHDLMTARIRVNDLEVPP